MGDFKKNNQHLRLISRDEGLKLIKEDKYIKEILNKLSLLDLQNFIKTLFYLGGKLIPESTILDDISPDKVEYFKNDHGEKKIFFRLFGSNLCITIDNVTFIEGIAALNNEGHIYDVEKDNK